MPMIWMLIALFSSQTLAPHPLNFKDERVEIGNNIYTVKFDGAKLSLEEDLKPKNRIKWLLDQIYRKKRPPKDNKFDPMGCFGCFGAVIFCVLFWVGVGYLIWMFINA